MYPQMFDASRTGRKSTSETISSFISSLQLWFFELTSFIFYVWRSFAFSRCFSRRDLVYSARKNFNVQCLILSLETKIVSFTFATIPKTFAIFRKIFSQFLIAKWKLMLCGRKNLALILFDKMSPHQTYNNY